MPAIITKKGRLHASEQFLEAFTQSNNVKMFIFIGKTSQWDNEFSPPIPKDNDDEIRQAWNDMIGGEFVQASNISNVVRRINWSAGTVYDRYDDKEENLFETKNIYVITDSFNVYKCLDNNNSAQSTVKPTGTGTSVIETADGYKWKFMYNISTAKVEKFLTEDWMPIQFLDSDDGTSQWTVQQNAVEGSIEAVRVTASGTGYTSAPTVTISGDGSGAKATAEISNGEITNINITNAGSGYTRATIEISGGSGTGGQAEAIFSPQGGHGSNALRELGGFLTMVSVTLDDSESGTLPTTNDFRKIGVIKDPLDFGTTTITTKQNFNQATVLNISSVSGSPSPDDIVEGDTSGAKGKVIWYDNANSKVHINEITGNFQTSEGVTFDLSTATATLDTIDDPDLEPRTGEIVFLENRERVSRNNNQTEEIKIIFEF